MKKLVIGMTLGVVIGSVIGTIASDDIYDMKNMIMRKGKKILKKYDLM